MVGFIISQKNMPRSLSFKTGRFVQERMPPWAYFMGKAIKEGWVGEMAKAMAIETKGGNNMKRIIIFVLLLAVPAFGQYQSLLNKLADELPNFLKELHEEQMREEALEYQRQQTLINAERLRIERERLEYEKNKDKRKENDAFISAGFDPIDTNSDGRYDVYALNNIGDWDYDVVANDKDFDGYIDIVEFDDDGDGINDRVLYDKDNNNILEYWLFDNDGDGSWDEAGVDTNGDY